MYCCLHNYELYWYLLSAKKIIGSQAHKIPLQHFTGSIPGIVIYILPQGSDSLKNLIIHYHASTNLVNQLD
jgi:hypothetical protein